MADNFLDGAREVIRNAYCGALTPAAGYLNWASSARENLGIPGPIIDVPAALINGANGLFCNRVPGPIPPEVPPQFTGGQCVGSRYNVAWVVDVVGGQAGPRPNNVNVIGPVVGLTDRVEGNFTILELISEGGANTLVVGNFSNVSPAATYDGFRDVVVTPRFNDPDDCGDLPGTRPTEPPPGTDVPVDDDIVVDDGNGPINIPVDISFSPVSVSVDGDLNVGFNINNPDFSLFGALNLTTGDINFNFGGRKPDNEQCCLPPDLDDNDQPEEGEEDPPETQQTIVGVLVNSVVVTDEIRSTLVAQENGPDFYNPRVGNIYFQLRVEGQIFWTAPIKIQHENQYVQCPVDFGAIRVVANPIQGVTMRLSPIRRRILVDEFP